MLEMENIANIPRIYTAIAEWMACIVFILQFPRKYSYLKSGFIVGLFLIFQCSFMVLTGDFPITLWIPCMLTAILLMFLFMRFMCDGKQGAIIYATVRAFILAELAASFSWQMYYSLIYKNYPDLKVLQAISIIIVICAVFAVALFMENRLKVDGRNFQVSKKEIISAMLIGITAFLMSNISFVYENTPFSASANAEINIIRTMMDVAGYLVLYVYHVQLIEMRIKYELDTLQRLLNSQYMQYKQSRESIELVNRKYHDLKHQIAILRAENSEERRNAFLDEMENEINVYEAQNKTGNPVLDTVLTAKKLYCAKHQIEMTCVADGSLFKFMDAMDISTIFGNALDNAIECELRIPEKEKRLISLIVHKEKAFIVIRCENYFEGKLTFKDGFPLTDKSDQRYHGFGIKSIQYSVEKYNGNVTAAVNKNWFELTIMIPV